jgi:hypothetical protein
VDRTPNKKAVGYWQRDVISNLYLVHCNENPIYVLLFGELRGLSPNIHIHVSVSDLYIPKISTHISCSRIGRSIVGTYKSLTDT